MTWLWLSLIVIGVAMIVAAFWPTIRGRKDKGENEDGVAER
ncbi:hypothetical protein GCM10010172_08840 [Paractinoplanes ferrugineus]|uniref:Uncharacterized protein n=1 Tax=Paractinoplanes ferrugineus TaxID=113564 RepID=A0A919IWG6_9ACTN|nr:hypothetical protein [Actinoplanes ferrugineus]GIE09449.1 hypothetical protein Afe05nite_12890 [Actinoplanes ferrugineus]